MKSRSVMTYIMTTWFIAEIIMFSVITLFVHLYITQSVELDIRSSLSRQVTSLSNAIVRDKENFVVDESKIEKRFSDMYIAVLTENGDVIWGEVPEGIIINTERSVAPVRATVGKEAYYYIDRDIRYSMANKGFARAYVNEKEILRSYARMEFVSCGGIAVVFAALTAVMVYALRHFRNSVKAMESSVEKIGVTHRFDEHMDESGHYREIRSLIEANNRMIDRMNEVFDQQDQFSSDVAHELRTPISVVKAQSQYALNNMELSAEERKSFEVILKQAQKMQNLVITLLDLSRLDAAYSENMQEIIDMNEIVCAICEAEQDRLSDSEVEFNITSGVVSETSGNISLITIAVTNLISNAVKFSHENDVIEVETGEKDNFVFVKVKDSGTGMNEEEKNKVFTRFYKTDSLRNSSGYGLGMPLAYKIAKKHGGTIEFESESGKGSCFTLFILKK